MKDFEFQIEEAKRKQNDLKKKIKKKQKKKRKTGKML